MAELPVVGNASASHNRPPREIGAWRESVQSFVLQDARSSILLLEQSPFLTERIDARARFPKRMIMEGSSGGFPLAARAGILLDRVGCGEDLGYPTLESNALGHAGENSR